MKKSRHAFTLIELLVVVAIIALLISILMPSLSRARQQAKTALCQSNLHQIGLGLFMYAEQHKGKTINIWPNRYLSPPAPFLWDYSYHSMLAGGASQLGGVVSQRTGFVGKSKEVFFCPDRPDESHVTAVNAGFNTVPGIATTYAYNETGWSEPAAIFEGWLTDGRSLASIKRPFEKIWIGEASNIAPEIDGWQLGYSTDGFWSPNPPPYQKLTWKDIYNAPGCKFSYSFVEPAVRHGRGNVCLYFDGRAEVVREMIGRNWRVRF